MPEFPVRGAEPAGSRPTPARRALLTGGRGILYGVVGFFALAPATQQADPAMDHATLPVVLAIIAMLLNIAWLIVMWQHRRTPIEHLAVAAAIALVLPSTAAVVLLALGEYLLQPDERPRPRLALALALAVTTAAVLITLLWDAHSFNSLLTATAGRDSRASFLASLPWRAPLVAIVLVAITAAIGLHLRTRHERAAAEESTEEAVGMAAGLSDDLSRLAERQEVAREIHDTLASRLSALSLHAGALELTVAADGQGPQAAEAARIVRESAQQSIDDLRNVIDVLRHPERRDAQAGRKTLEDVATLLDEAHATGDRLRSRLVVSDAAGCDPHSAHACFRIVQESLSNARRQAPGAEVEVEVRGGPGTGIGIRIVNRLAADHAPVTLGGGHGVLGMRERAERLGGRFEAVRQNDSFVVTAQLPWIVGTASMDGAPE